jgi:hypothetical protein
LTWDDIPKERRAVLLQQHHSGSVVTTDGGPPRSPASLRPRDQVPVTQLHSIRTWSSLRVHLRYRLSPSRFIAPWLTSPLRQGWPTRRKIAPTSVVSSTQGRL